MPSKSIALATYQLYLTKDFEDPEVLLLQKSLQQLGFQTDIHIWNSQNVDWKKYDLVVIRSTWDYYTHFEQFLKWLKTVSQETKILNPLPVMMWNLDKKKYLSELQAKGVNIIPSVFVEKSDRDEVSKCLSKWETIVIKPTVGAWSNMVERFSKLDAALQHLQMVIQKCGSAIIQPYCKEIEKGELSLVFIEDKFSHGLRKIPAKGEFRSQHDGGIGGSMEAYKPTESEIQFGKQVLKVVAEIFKDTSLLYARVDYLVCDGKCSLMELELVEPYLYPEFEKGMVDLMAKCIQNRLK